MCLAGSLVAVLGGAGIDIARGITVDDAGNAYITGSTSAEFPTLNAFQAENGGGFDDVFVAKLNPSGALVFSTFLGGSGTEWGFDIAVDKSHSVYVTGFSNGSPTGIPTTDNAFQPRWSGGFCNIGSPFVRACEDAFVTKLSSDGTALVYSTYLGARGEDERSLSIDVDATGHAYLTGFTTARDTFPTADPLQGASGGMDDTFVTKLSPDGSSLVYSTYLGGSGDDHGNAITVDAAGNAYLAGSTDSSDFPTSVTALQPVVAGGIDGFLVKLDAEDFTITYSTYLGGTNDDFVRGIAVDEAYTCMTGWSNSTDFATTPDALQLTQGGGDSDAFLTRIDTAASGARSLVFSSFLGGGGSDAGNDIVIDSNGNAFLTGSTGSINFPTVNPFQPVKADGADAFVIAISFP